MGAKQNARKRAAKAAAAEQFRIASNTRRALLATDKRRQVSNLLRPGGYYGAPLPDEVDKQQPAYVDGKGNPVEITPENAATVSRYATARPAKRHTKRLSEDSSPSTVATAPTAEESLRIRDVKASDVYHRNAITPPRAPKPARRTALVPDRKTLQMMKAHES